MEHTFREAMVRLIRNDMLGGDTKSAQVWMVLQEPPGGQPWRFASLDDGNIWSVEIEWKGDDLHISHGDYGGGFSGIVKSDGTSVEDEDPNDPPFVAGPDYPVATMLAAEIDVKIRELLGDYSTWGLDGPDGARHWLPLAADPVIWEKVCKYAEDECDPGGGADCRPGRLYELTDEEIKEAEVWLRAHPNTGAWEDLQQTMVAGGTDAPYPVALKYIDAAFIR